MDDTQREKNSGAPSEQPEEGDYELEPPDAEVLAAEERRAREAIEASNMAIDIDEIYRDLNQDHGREILESWWLNFRFRFQVKHLLIGTALLAIGLALYRLELLRTAILLLVMVSVIGLYLYLQWQEKKQQDEAARRWRAMYERRREYLERKLRPNAERDLARADAASRSAIPPEAFDSAMEPHAQNVRPPFRFQFSMLELMAVMSAAAIILAVVHVVGGPSNAATVLGLLALLGLVIHAMGFEPPEVVVLGWWLILLLYVVLSVAAFMWSGLA